MIKRFYAEPGLANSFWVLVVCGIIFVLVSWDAGTIHKPGAQLILLSFFLLTGLFWAGAKYGTYVEIDTEKKNVGSKSFFIPVKETSLSEVIALKTSSAFAGGVTYLEMVLYDKYGSLTERGITSKEILTKSNLKELISTIHQVNPNIKIPEELLR